mgnify:CR=1 FL=1
MSFVPDECQSTPQLRGSAFAWLISAASGANAIFMERAGQSTGSILCDSSRFLKWVVMPSSNRHAGGYF